MTSIIIVHWNTPELLRKLLTNLSSFKGDVIVVDNNSEKSLDWVKKEFTQIELIENKTNRGFAFACNQGAVHAKEEWLLFLNPDVFIDENDIDYLKEYANKYNLDAISPKPQSKSYEKPVPSALSLLVEFTPLKNLVPLSVFGTKTLTGGALLIKRAVFEELGGFDERFFIWFEDSDLTHRLLSRGYKIGFSDRTVEHSGGESFKLMDEPMKTDIFFHSMDVFAQKKFSFLSKALIHLLHKHYSSRKVLPILNRGVSITVPNMNVDLLETFLQKNGPHLETIDELIIVTSGLSAKNVWEFRKKYSAFRFILLEKNRGYANTANTGFSVSTTEWIGTVNDDTVLTDDWIEKCLACAKNPGSQARNDPGSLNPIIFKENGEIESAGVDVLSFGKAIPRKEIYSRHSESAEGETKNLNCYSVDATNAAAVLYTNEALNKCGVFDERFGSYLEDIDLSLRLTRNGFENIVVSAAKITHIGHATSKNIGAKKQFYDARNWWLVILKNWGLQKIILNAPSIFIERLRNLSGLMKAFLLQLGYGK